VDWEQIRNQDTGAANRKRTLHADVFAREIAELLHNRVIPAISNEGEEISRKKMAGYLKAMDSPTRRGGEWTTTQVSRIFQRLQKLHEQGR
jgi:hypothetical protein